MGPTVSHGLLRIEPGAINPHTQSLSTVKPGTLCWVGEEEWCMCIVPGTRSDGIMIGGDKNLQHFVLPVSDVVLTGDGSEVVWCIVSGLGVVQMGANAHVRILDEAV